MSINPLRKTTQVLPSENVSLPPTIAHAIDLVIQKMQNLRLTTLLPLSHSVRLHCQLSGRELKGRALKVDSKTYFQLANLKKDQGDIQGYENCLILAAAGAKSTESKLNFLISLYYSQFERESYKQALSTCIEILSLKPNHPEWVCNQALCSLNLKQLSKASELYCDILDFKPEDLKDSIREEAIDGLIHALKNPELHTTQTSVLVDLHVYLFRLQVLINNYHGALSTCNHVAPLLSENDSFWLISQAFCHLKLRNYNFASQLYNAILDLGFDRLQHEREACLQAVQDLQEAYNNYPPSEGKIEILNLIHEFHILLGQHNEAYETCLEIEKLEPNSTALEQIQALYSAERIFWEEMQSCFNQAYVNRRSLHVQLPMVQALAQKFNEMNLTDLATLYQNWAQELNF